MQRRTRTSLLFAVVVLAGLSGCNAQPVPVSGRVTLEGKPLSLAFIRFIKEGARNSSGVTDEEGYYELEYSRDKMGALPGEYRVMITTADPEDEAVEELVPDRYNSTKSELTFVVPKQGTDQANFDLPAE